MNEWTNERTKKSQRNKQTRALIKAIFTSLAKVIVYHIVKMADMNRQNGKKMGSTSEKMWRKNSIENKNRALYIVQ